MYQEPRLSAEWGMDQERMCVDTDLRHGVDRKTLRSAAPTSNDSQCSCGGRAYPSMSNTSSWGGNVLQVDGKYHLFVRFWPIIVACILGSPIPSSDDMP
jgi:hypothetical protein